MSSCSYLHLKNRFKRSGQAISTVTVIETFITTVLLLGIVTGAQFQSTDIIRKETLDVHVTRIENAALALTSVPTGHIEVPLNRGYEFRYQSGEIYLRYQGEETSTRLNLLEGGYSDVDGPGSYTEVDGKICLVKDGERLEFRPEEC